MKSVSILTACYNEEDNVEELYSLMVAKPRTRGSAAESALLFLKELR
jgi:hypothetical protein